MCKSPATKLRAQGFTLMELMVAMAIIAILSAIAYPSYTSMLVNNRRLEAQGALMGFVTAMERYRADNSTYVSAAVGTVYPAQAPIDSGDKFYDLSITSQAGSSYILRATPINNTSQEDDGYLEITSTGIKRWDKDNSGSTNSSENTWDD
ncbi:type IV pilin protein [Motiliproteus sp. MSK22-1]|uniref:type IV pilin protein n=1 Tax=Motiliproteus sp. MSK22-1 TaxID=1897630 RepID=UPI000976D255|nr:type IV pilin protein [Motiliproteus sp. MSK22-1]OMH34035.1 hypothetical protein BGP75_12030 [Motiliproteus sp. MSK22-1]